MKTYRKPIPGHALTQVYNSRANGSDYEWKEVYKRFYAYDPRVVQVLDVDADYIIMERLEGWTLDDTAKLCALEARERKQILQTVVSLHNSMLQWSDSCLDESTVWMHNDMDLQNFMYTDSGIRLIDPESFDVRTLGIQHNNSRYGKFFELYVKLLAYV